MPAIDTFIPIHPHSADAAARSHCSACLAGDAAPVCRSQQGEPCAATVLHGPEAELRRLLAALGERLGFSPEAPEQAGVRGLFIQPGEVELQLAMPADCAGAAVHEVAFDTLRHLLPDTDIYVRHGA